MTLWRMESGTERKLATDSPLGLAALVSLIAIAAVPAFVLLLPIPLSLVPPLLSVLSFLIACGVALYALLTKASRDAPGLTSWNVAYAFTSVWIVAAVISSPKHLLDWFEKLSLVP